MNVEWHKILFILGSLENSSTNEGDEKIVKTNIGTNAQHFVLLLKEKLEKPSLKKLISEIKAYKEQGLIDPLLNLLTEYSVQKIISKDDVEKFRPFVRKEDESAFNKIL